MVTQYACIIRCRTIACHSDAAPRAAAIRILHAEKRSSQIPAGDGASPRIRVAVQFCGRHHPPRNHWLIRYKTRPQVTLPKRQRRVLRCTRRCFDEASRPRQVYTCGQDRRGTPWQAKSRG